MSATFKPVLPTPPARRNAPIDVAALEAMKGVSTLRDAENAAHWDRHIPIAPDEFRRVLMTGMPPRADGQQQHLWMGWNRDGTCLTVCYYIHEASGWKLLSDARDFDFDKGYVVHKSLELDDDWHGRGIARQRLVNALTLYPALGLTGIRLNAGNTVGGYAWARMGFEPPEWNWLQLRDMLRDRMDAMWQDLPAGARALVEPLLESRDPRSLWQLADLREPVVKGETLGASLLLGSHWIGHLDFDRTEQMERLRNYLFPKGGAAPKRQAAPRPV